MKKATRQLNDEFTQEELSEIVRWMEDNPDQIKRFDGMTREAFKWQLIASLCALDGAIKGINVRNELIEEYSKFLMTLPPDIIQSNKNYHELQKKQSTLSLSNKSAEERAQKVRSDINIIEEKIIIKYGNALPATKVILSELTPAIRRLGIKDIEAKIRQAIKNIKAR